MKRGDHVRVYRDSITCVHLEQTARVVKAPTQLPWDDAHGRPVFRATVKFAGDPATYDRDVSEVIS